MAANNNGLSASGGGVVVLTYQLFITFGACRQVGCFLFPACGKPKSVSLKESYDLLKLDKLKAGYETFVEIADLWISVSQLFEKVSQTKDIKFIEQASGILKTISDKEKKTMEILATI
jgi:hypothetical protein